MVSRWKTWARRAGWAVLGLLLLFGLWRLALAEYVSTQLADIHDKSYPVTLAELNRWYPPVTPADNAAILFDKAFASFVAQSDPPAQTATDPLDGNDDVLALLQQASNSPRCRFPIDLGRLSIMPYPHLASLIRAAHLLENDAANNAVCTDPQPAIVSVESLFALTHSLAKEPLVRSHLTRLRCQEIAVDSLQNLLNGTRLTDQQLDALGSAMEKVEDQQALARAFIGQRCIGIYGFDVMQRAADPTALPAARKYSVGQRLLLHLGALLGSPAYLYNLCGLLQWDELEYLRSMDCYIETAQTAFPERIDAARTLRQALDRDAELHSLSRAWLRGMNGPRVILKDAASAARLREARMAIAVERYRLEHNDLPQTLDELKSPAGAVPADPFSGRPLRYARLSNGYAIQSVCQSEPDGTRADGLETIAFIVER
ncbi:MAG TPA: hypothetical protein VMV72_16740 [Verrucomicrobiae bacterium]|nr:hypothetical protein [Verrucomicrobiae bacterium]